VSSSAGFEASWFALFSSSSSSGRVWGLSLLCAELLTRCCPRRRQRALDVVGLTESLSLSLLSLTRVNDDDDDELLMLRLRLLLTWRRGIITSPPCRISIRLQKQHTVYTLHSCRLNGCLYRSIWKTHRGAKKRYLPYGITQGSPAISFRFDMIWFDLKCVHYIHVYFSR